MLNSPTPHYHQEYGCYTKTKKKTFWKNSESLKKKFLKKLPMLKAVYTRLDPIKKTCEKNIVVSKIVKIQVKGRKEEKIQFLNKKIKNKNNNNNNIIIIIIII